MPYARRGDPAAVNNLGVIANDCRNDRSTAISYYTLAARMGYQLARVNLAALGQPVPAPDLVRSSSSSDVGAALLLLQAARPRPAQSSNTTNCTTRSIGGTLHTQCW
jgi:TPR repeat protein